MPAKTSSKADVLLFAVPIFCNQTTLLFSVRPTVLLFSYSVVGCNFALFCSCVSVAVGLIAKKSPRCTHFTCGRQDNVLWKLDLYEHYVRIAVLLLLLHLAT